MIEELPFHIQRIQTDRGMEFFAEKFQRKLKEYAIKFRPNRPGSPHLNGKVERSQKTDLEEFWALIDIAAPNLADRLRDWQDYYNHERPHSSLGGKTPWERWNETFRLAPFGDELESQYDASKERIRYENYKRDLELVALGR